MGLNLVLCRNWLQTKTNYNGGLLISFSGIQVWKNGLVLNELD